MQGNDQERYANNSGKFPKNELTARVSDGSRRGNSRDRIMITGGIQAVGLPGIDLQDLSLDLVISEVTARVITIMLAEEV